MSRLWLKTKLTGRYFLNRWRDNPVHAAVEVTKRCNAHCQFCDYWQTRQETPLDDYSEVVRRLGVLYVSITGGEPLMRKDLEAIIRRIKERNIVYIGVITNGWLLDVERAQRLIDAGLDQLAVSLDFPDRRHDEFRGLPGLFARVSELLPRLARMDFDVVTLNTVIMKDNVDDILPLAELARRWGVRISLSAYNRYKSSNGHLWMGAEHQEKVRHLVDGIMAFKDRYGNVRNSDYYLRHLPRYFTEQQIGGCQAGRKWVQVTPEGKIKACSEMPEVCDHTEYDKELFAPVTCQRCWYSCRGESQAPVDWKRYKEFF